MKKIIVGLTGQSGAGKTTVSLTFENQGFEILNADKISRDITNETIVLNMLSNTFGNSIIEGGKLNRKELAKIVFSNKEKLNLLNNIMFPFIKEKMNLLINQSSNKFILLDAPQLFEAGADDMCDYVVSVVASKEKLLERITERDNISKEDALKRLNSQYNQDFFKEKSDFVIENIGTIKDLYNKTEEIIKNIKTKDQT